MTDRGITTRSAAITLTLLAALGFAVATGRGHGNPHAPLTAAEPRPLIVAQATDAQINRKDAPLRGAVTNLPLPRYVSLKGSDGNARRGPSLSHRIDWVFRHAGMPLRVVAEFGHWRRVEDKDGMGGWVHYSLISGVRTALITQNMAELRARPRADADVVARAEAGAILRLNECDRDWCRVSGAGERGWLPKTAIWGVDRDELRE